MLTKEYLEIVRLAELLLLQQIPTKPIALPKALTAPIETSELPLPAISKPALILKEEPIPIEKKIPPVEIPLSNLDPILDMLKTHCSKLKLVDLPVEIKKTVIVLYDQESEPEKKLLENISSALKKEGHSSHLLLASELQQAHLQNSANILIGSRTTFSNQQHIKIHARRDSSGKLFIAENGALAISSLSELIEQPSKRLGVWNEILGLL